MKIIQVVQEFSTNGGVENVAYELQRSWLKNGVHSRVISGIAPGCDERPDITTLVSLVGYIPTRGPYWKYLGRMVVLPWFSIKVTKLLRRLEKNYVILSHGDSFIGDALIVHAVNKASILAKKKAGQYAWILNPMHWWIGMRDRFMIGGLRYKLYIALSQRIASELETFYNVPRDKIKIIPNGVNLDRFNPIGSGRREIRAEFNIPDDTKVMLFVGHEFGRKGLTPIIEALSRLDKNVHLLVVGNDDLKPYAALASKYKVEHRVHFAGPRKNVEDFNRAADIFVFPTAYEAFALVAMEALASGLPLLATKVGGVEDYLVNGMNGYYIEATADSISTVVGTVLANEGLLQMLKENARKTAMNYGWDNIANQYSKVLAKLDHAKHLD